MVPPDSDRVPPAPPYSGYSCAAIRFRIPGFHGLRPIFPDRSPNKSPSVSLSYNPPGAVTPKVWANPLSLTTTRGITVVFSSCGYLDVSVPRVRPILHGDGPLRPPGCPIRKPADQRLFAPTRGLSQLVTSFFASESPGIPRTLLLDFLVSRVLYCKSFLTFDSWSATP